MGFWKLNIGFAQLEKGKKKDHFGGK